MRIMTDGTTAYLAKSGNYYCRKYGDSISYYSLEGERIQLAKAKCKKCGDIMVSKRCGDFVQCSCGESFVDTDRWFPERHRYGGGINCDYSYGADK